MQGRGNTRGVRFTIASFALTLSWDGATLGFELSYQEPILMPVYEYVCPRCEAKFERLRPMRNGHQARCPDCNTDAPRVISMFAAFTRGARGEMSPVAGGGCACAAGGSCACAGE